MFAWLSPDVPRTIGVRHLPLPIVGHCASRHLDGMCGAMRLLFSEEIVMRPIRRLAAALFALLLSAVAQSGVAQGQTDAQSFDTRLLPRLADSTEKDVRLRTLTKYSLTGEVGPVAEAVIAKLGADGWQYMPSPRLGQRKWTSLATLLLKKNAQWIKVYVKPERNGSPEIEVIYQTQLFADDFAFPDGATDIAFDPHFPHLVATVPMDIDAAFTHFSGELTGKKWQQGETSRHSLGSGAATSRISSTFTRDPDKRVGLEVKLVAADRTKVEIAPVRAAKSVTAQKKEEDDKDDSDARFERMARDLIKQAMESPAKRERQRATTAQEPAPAEPLRAKADTAIPVPIPETAEATSYDETRGSLGFDSASSVASVAGFYRKEMPSLGWQSAKSVIDGPNMVVLKYTKGGKALSFTIMQMGPRTKVSADGTALVTKPAQPTAQTSRPASEPRMQGGLPSLSAQFPSDAPSEALVLAKLEAVDVHDVLVVPKPNVQQGRMKSMFRLEASAMVAASLETITAFYQREAEKRSWKGAAADGEVKPDATSLAYTTPDGPITLQLQHRSGWTSVTLVARKEREAAEAKMLPNPGAGKLMFANGLPAEWTAGIDGKSIRIKPGLGTKKPDGPSVDLKPGKYAVTLKSGAKSMPTVEVSIEPGQIWGVMLTEIGPLPVQMY